MEIKPIRTEDDYRETLHEIECLMSAAASTPEGKKLDVLVTLVEAYERKYYPLDLPDPVEAIKFEMEQQCLTVRDLEPIIGKSNRVYEILNHKRPLTLRMVWGLHKRLGIPAESLIKPREQPVDRRGTTVTRRSADLESRKTTCRSDRYCSADFKSSQ